MIKMISKRDYQSLATLINKYSFDEVKHASQVINQNNLDSNNGQITGSKTKLRRNDFGILSTIQKQNSYRSIIQALESIERLR